MTEIRLALAHLTDLICNACTIGEALAEAAGPDGGPSWLSVYRHQLDAIRDAADALECALNAPRGGIGGVAPDAEPPASEPAPLSTRAPLGSLSNRPSSRPEDMPSTASE